MGLPSNVPRYQGDATFPDFEALEPRFVSRPATSRLRAWYRLGEVERRLDFFDWLLHVARDPLALRRLVEDSSTAFLLSFESCVQILKTECGGSPAFDKWLSHHDSYTIVSRGLRTLRNIEAHLRVGELSANGRDFGSSRFAAGVDPGRTVRRHFSPISTADFVGGPLHRCKLKAGEIDEWNQLTSVQGADDVMRLGIKELVKILYDAEPAR